MSTILDALSKAERERRLGSLPDLHFPQIASAAGQRKRGVAPGWLLAIAAGLIGAAAVWWTILLADGNRIVVMAPASPPSTGNSEAGVQARKDDSDRDRSTYPDRTGPGPQVPTDADDGRAHLRSGVAWSTQADRRSEAATARSKATPVTMVDTGTDAAKGVGQRVAEKPPPKTDGSGTAAKPGIATAPAVEPRTEYGANVGFPGRETTAQAGNQTDSLPPYAHQLPADVRNQLPQLKIGGYIYSDRPAERSVLIDNKLLREGDSVAPELQLEQLRPDGVILNYRGRRYRLGY